MWAVSAHARRLVTLALAGLVIAVLTRRPEFAGVAAPAVLLLAARRPGRPGQVGVSVRTSATSLSEGESADLQVAVTGYGDHSVDLTVHPRYAVAPGAGGRGDGGEASLPFQVTRWGRRSLGVLEITLRDRWRLTEGHATVELPTVDCYPRPGRSGPGWCSAGCPAAWASTRPGRPGRGWSSPACASSSPVTGSAGSTGRPPPGAGGCS